MRILLGLAVLVVLALLASSRRWWSFRRYPVGTVLTTGGWLTIGVGMLLGPHAIALVNAEHVETLKPLILFCLGWAGLMIGMQLRLDLPKLLPAGSLRIALIDSVASLLLIAGGAAAAFAIVADTPDAPWQAVVVVALLLAVCGIGWPAEIRSLLRGEQRSGDAANLLRAGSGLASVVAVLAYGVVFMLIKYGQTVELSIAALLIGLAVCLIIAAVFGLLGYWLMSIAGRSESQFLVVLLGLVAFAAGAAAVLGYSPIFMMLLCGAVTINLPGEMLQRFRRVIIDAEQFVAMALMLIAGVIAEPWLGRTGLIVLGMVLVARATTKLLFVRPALLRHHELNRHDPLAWAPLRQAPVGIALATGYAVSGHAPVTDDALSGGRIVMIVIIIGLLTDLLPVLLRLGRPAGRPVNAESEARA